MIKRVFKISSLAVFAGLVMAQSGFAQDAEIPVVTAPAGPHWSTIDDFDARHDACLTAIASDADVTYEDALIWKNDGGGRRARHCVAMALFALGHKQEAANRLEAMGAEIGSGTPQMRADRYTESADFWLASGDDMNAVRAAGSALDLSPKHLGARLTRARAYAQMERWDYAETDLTSALVYYPGNAQALRYRADARRRQGKLSAALADAEQSLRYDPKSVESALVRGEIREALRVKKEAAAGIKTRE